MSKRSAPLLVFLFWLSGFLGLVYEVLWIRKLTLVFGATTLALMTVLAAFFGGMAVGSYLFGRIAQRAENCIFLYAALEAGMGAFALGFPTLLRTGDQLYALIYPFLREHIFLLYGCRLLLGFGLLLIPTALMGGTLPVLCRHFVVTGSHVSSRIGGLYAVNTMGGAMGAFTAGYFLIARLGVDSSTYLAGGLNLVVGAMAWWIGRNAEVSVARTPMVDSRPGPFSGKLAGRGERTISPRSLAWVTLAFGVSGFTGIAYEIVWVRYLSLFMTTSIYATSAMLTVFLFGLALGSFLFSRVFDHRKRLLTIFGLLQLGIGALALLVTPALLALDPPMAMDTAQLVRFQFFVCFALMLLPTTLMGAVLPLVSRIVIRRADHVARDLGLVYA